MKGLSLKNKKYGSYPRNAKLYDLPIEYEQRLFTKQPIDLLNHIIVERLKVSSIEWSFKVIFEIPTLMNYILMVMKGWSLDDEYIV